MANARTRRTTKPKRSYDPEQSRAALLDAAVELLGTKGFHETSVQELADAANLTKGAFYHHFGSKEDVLHEIHDDFLDEYLEHQERILRQFETAHEQMFHLVRLLVLVVAERQPQVQIFYREQRTLGSDRFPETYRKRHAAEVSWVASIRRGVERGEFRAELDPELAAFAILGMGNWAHLWYRPDGRFEPSRIATAFAEQALLGITARPRTVRALVGRRIPDDLIQFGG